MISEIYQKESKIVEHVASSYTLIEFDGNRLTTVSSDLLGLKFFLW
jgi:hypothetical protein